MDFLMTLSPLELSAKRETNLIIAANQISRQFGLTLTHEEALELIAERNHLLKSLGRIELGYEIIPKLIEAFSASAYLSEQTYLEILHGLVRIFYHCRGEFGLDVTDDDLIDWMRETFEDQCRGSLELLEGRELDAKLRGYRGLDYEDESEIEDTDSWEMEERYEE